jgi:hypothetical protein
MSLYNKASLVMIPSGYKSGKVYSQKPTDGSGDLSFTRASDGTRINSAGLVEVMPWNLVQYSEDFNNGVWSKYQASVTANTTTAPNGTLTADTLQDNAANDSHITYQTPNITAGTYTISVYAKASTLSNINLVLFDGVSTSYGSNRFDLSNGTTTGANQSIENVGNGWYRCSFTLTTTLSGVQYVYVFLNNGTSSVYTGTGSGAVFIWGYQLNIGSTAKPYFPTTDRLNVPRLTYQNGGGGCPSLLLEKQSTNVLAYSQINEANAYYSVFNTTTTANNAISPDGTQNATNFNFDANAAARVEKALSGTYENQTHTVSVYAKVTSGTQQFRLKCTHAGIVDYLSNDLTVTTEWQRFTFTQAFGASVGSGIVPGITNSTNGTAKNILFYGFQVEVNSSYATSLINTNGASATRVSDACLKTGASALIGQSEGTIFLDFVINGQSVLANAVNIYNNDYSATTISTIAITYSDGLITCQTFKGNGTFDAVTINASTYTIGQRIKLAYRYKSGDFAVYINGVQVGTSATTMTFNGTKSEIYLDALNVYYGYPDAVKYNEFVQFKTGLSNADLQALTS